MQKRQGSKPPQREEPAAPPADIPLAPAGMFDVPIHTATPKGPADKQVHPRRPLPATPEAPPRPQPNDKK